MPAKIRKHQTTLICSGLAVIAFGLWSIVRSGLLMILNMTQAREAAAEGLSTADFATSADTLVRIVYALILVALALDLIFRLYVGLSAISEGGGKPRRKTYIVLSALYLALSLCGDVATLAASSGDESMLGAIVAVLVDFSACVAFFEIVRSALAIRRYNRCGAIDRGEEYAA